MASLHPSLPLDPTRKIGSDNKKTQEPYEVKPDNWLYSLPYGFSFYSVDTNANSPTSTIYLPISPSNINVKTHFATNVVTTLYGVIEEHSEVRYYEINISGTTGISPRYVGPQASTPASNPGRESFAEQPVFNKTVDSFLPEVTNTLKQVKGVIQDVQGKSPGDVSGVSNALSGYVAFHELYKFFLKYKQDASAANQNSASQGGGLAAAVRSAIGGSKKNKPKRKTHPITFLNYKDNVKYDCVPREFTLTRSNDNPMLYNYNIRLLAYNLRSINDPSDTAQALNDLKAKLGLSVDSGSSLFSDLSNRVTSAATLISAVL